MAEIVAMIAGVIFTCYLMYLLQKRNEKIQNELHSDSKRQERINRVVSEYTDLRRNLKSSDIPGLIEANIAGLETEQEAKEAIRLISLTQNNKNPLSSLQQSIEEIGILKFFRNITRMDYMTGKTTEIIKKLKD
jgi:hypothetical protein